MSETATGARQGRIEFTGSRHELLGIIVRGYLLMVPTIGLYRFWQSTWKRRFYWQNTVIDGDPIEYTGTASQLLVGFFFALAFFVPIYVALFYLSMQDTDLVLLGYLGAGAVVWFLSGYAIYRARDFRLSRTMWRGIGFDQAGNAWAYALRRFLWSVLMVPTFGLVYPWMASSLWRYRYRHTWFGNRKFEISGNWRAIAGPYYSALIVNLLTMGGTFVWLVSVNDFSMVSGVPIPGPIGLLLVAGCIGMLTLSIAWYRAAVASRMLSTVTVGDTALRVRMPAGPLFAQYIGYAAAFVGLLILLSIVALVIVGGVVAAASAGGGGENTATLMAFFQSGSLNVALLIAIYLVVLGAFGLVGQIILSFGWWALLARSTTFTNPDGLRSVRARGEDRSVIGEGLADALNVGAY